MAEISIGGVFIPAVLLWAIVAFCLNAIMRRILAGIGFYALVWHRALFDLAMYVILLGGTVGLASRIVGP